MSTFTKRIDSDIRDINHYFSSPDWYVNVDLANYIGKSGSGSNNMGLRFTGVTVPKDATINSAKITFRSNTTQTLTSMALLIKGIAEDNTGEFVASPESSARTRSKTTASVSWSGTLSQTSGTDMDSPDIKDIVQEIVNRASWSSGNAMAFYLYDNGGPNDKELYFKEYADNTAQAALLTIEYTVTTSPSASVSPSASISPSSSSSHSTSPSASISPSASYSPSASPSPSPEPVDFGLKIAKPGINKDVQDITDPKEFIFTSAKGVLGLRQLTTISGTTDANGDIAITQAHNIGYPCITLVKFTGYDDSIVMLPIEWHSTYLTPVPDRYLIETTEVASFKIDATNIYINLHAEYYNHDLLTGGNLASRLYVFKVYYYFNEIVETA